MSSSARRRGAAAPKPIPSAVLSPEAAERRGAHEEAATAAAARPSKRSIERARNLAGLGGSDDDDDLPAPPLDQAAAAAQKKAKRKAPAAAKAAKTPAAARPATAAQSPVRRAPPPSGLSERTPREDRRPSTRSPGERAVADDAASPAPAQQRPGSHASPAVTEPPHSVPLTERPDEEEEEAAAARRTTDTEAADKLGDEDEDDAPRGWREDEDEAEPDVHQDADQQRGTGRPVREQPERATADWSDVTFQVLVLQQCLSKKIALFVNEPYNSQGGLKLWRQVAEEVSVVTGKKVIVDYLRKKVWKGQGGSRPMVSLMQQAAPDYRTTHPPGESGDATEPPLVQKICESLIALADSAKIVNKEERERRQEDAGRDAEASEGMEDALGGAAGRHGDVKSGKAKRAAAQASRSPKSALDLLKMPALVQRAWRKLNDFETNLYANHPKPTGAPRDDPLDALDDEEPGWVYRKRVATGKLAWEKVHRHEKEEYGDMLEKLMSEEDECAIGEEDWEKDLTAVTAAGEHATYLEWLGGQNGMVKQKLALMAQNVADGGDGGGGGDGPPPSEMAEAGAAMERASQAQADAQMRASAERAATAKQKSTDKLAMHAAELQDRAAARDEAAEERKAREQQQQMQMQMQMQQQQQSAQQQQAMFGLMAQHMGVQLPTMPPPTMPPMGAAGGGGGGGAGGGAGGSVGGGAGSSVTFTDFDDVDALLASIGMPDLRAAFDQQRITLEMMIRRYRRSGELGLDKLLESVSSAAGAREAIIDALVSL